MATKQFVLSAGHRNEDRGGAWRGPESAWTYGICQQLRDAIIRRGGMAWIISEHDGDWDKSFSHGRGLQNVARLCVDLAAANGGVLAYLSMHYGAEPVDGFFSIYADAFSGADVAANNTLDITLARTLAKHVRGTGMGIRGNGTMSEQKSGVGLEGYRLGELVGTMGFRQRTARLIVEAGNSLSDREYAMLWSKAWQRQYVEAIVDSLEEQFGAFGGKRPDPTPLNPYAVGATVRATDRLNVRRGYSTDHPVVHLLDVGESATVIGDDTGLTTTFYEGREWVNLSGKWGTGWAASNWLEPVDTPPIEDPNVPTLPTFRTRYELPLRDTPGFNGRITATLPIGTEGTITSGPEEKDGIGWYVVTLEDGREGVVPASILRTLRIEGDDVPAADVDAP